MAGQPGPSAGAHLARACPGKTGREGRVACKAQGFLLRPRSLWTYRDNGRIGSKQLTIPFELRRAAKEKMASGPELSAGTQVPRGGRRQAKFIRSRTMSWPHPVWRGLHLWPGHQSPAFRTYPTPGWGICAPCIPWHYMCSGNAAACTLLQKYSGTSHCHQTPAFL